ncbi:MAG: penicillin-binding protein 2, partial [Gammaproteobacteria bacterium]
MNAHSDNANWRARALVLRLVFAAVAAVLLWRAVDLQVLDSDFLLDQGQARYLRTVEMPAHRGVIHDRNGDPLAVSTPVDSLWANPQELLGAADRIPELAHALGMKPAEFTRWLGKRKDREFVYLRRHMTPEDAKRVLARRIPGVYSQREYRRYYPAGEVTAHVLGFTNIDDRGQEGLELAYDDWLRGESGEKRVIKDRLGRTIEDVDSIQVPRPGHDLTTTLDLRLQYLAYRELKAAVQEQGAKSGSIVVLDSHTGEILAMADQPSFNPNNRSDLKGALYRNRAVTDVFEPGSSFKPFPIAAALDAGDVTPSTVVDTSPGSIKVAGYAVDESHDYGAVNVTTVLQKSINVGASHIAMRLAPEQLWGMLSRFGFGSLTGSGFPGEQSGLLRYYARWRPITQATLAYGYGINVTALQLAQAYNVFADNGLRQPVSLVMDQATGEPQRVISERAAREMRKMLESVVRDGGTGTRAAVPGYHVAGKTGTALKAENGGYARGRYTAVFAGMLPATRPRLVCVVVINEPSHGKYYGGLVAAPVFA